MHQIQPKSSLHYFAPHLAQQSEGTIRVRAKMKGFYDNTLREPGTEIRPADEFFIRSMDELAPWMELVEEHAESPSDDARAPERKPAAKPSKSKDAKKSENDVL